MDYDIDKYKEIVDNIFKEMNNEKNSIQFSKGISITHLSSENEEFAKNKILEELEEIRIHFLDFQNKCHTNSIYSYLMPALEAFGDYADSITEVIDNNIDVDLLDNIALSKYKNIKQFRMQILINAYNRYKKE